MDDIAIALEGLTKFYGPVKGVEDVTLEVRQGEIFGFLGPNGAGKTTCLRLIMGFIRPDRGSVRVLGRDLRDDRWRFKERVGMLPSDVDWWHGLSGGEVIDRFAGFRPDRPPVLRDRLCTLFRVETSLLARKMDTYSRGERRKIGLVVTLQHDPDLVLLDEPTSGLDPLLRKAFEALCRSLKARGKTVFLSSHNLFETQQICDRVGIVRRGDLVAVETIEELRRKNLRRVVLGFRNDRDLEAFQLEDAAVEERDAARLVLTYQGSPEALLQALQGIELDELIIAPPSLEDFFLQYFGKGEAR
jgi:ABC-2 type transport system ATP-binding protein